jgi:neutral amino acid transport system permease protein
MEAGGAVVATREVPLVRRLTAAADRHPARVALGVLAVIVVALMIAKGVAPVADQMLNGLSLGAVFALGAVGLTLVYGILKLVNFAHGDFLTFGVYMAYLVTVTWDAPLIVGVFWAMISTALLGIFLEKVMWGPMRERGAGLLQFVLTSIGLALVIRYAIQYEAGTAERQLDTNRTAVVEFIGLDIGRTQLIVLVIGVVVLLGVGLMLRYTLLGKRMRALSDNFDLAEASGINTSRIVLYTWIFAAGLAGLAGVLIGAYEGNFNPEIGFTLLLPIFAAVVLGGIGDAFGALAGAMLLGVMIELSTLVIDFRWKLFIGFVILILALIIRPQGIFGRAKSI